MNGISLQGKLTLLVLRSNQFHVILISFLIITIFTFGDKKMYQSYWLMRNPRLALVIQNFDATIQSAVLFSRITR